MKITFVYPNFADIRSGDAMHPLVFGILAALTPGDIECTLMDERVEAVNFDIQTDLVALSVQTFTAKRAYTIAARFRSRGIKVIMGGFHVTLVPREAARYADSIVLGQGEPVWKEILADLRKGKLKPEYRDPGDWPLKEVIPDRSIFQGKKYSLMVPLQFGRGCRNRCSFCSVRAFFGSRIQHRPVEEIVTEIKNITSPFLFFTDDNLTTNYTQARKLLEALQPLNKKWACQVSVDAAGDETLVALMARSGCMAVFMGFESLNRASLEEINKEQNLKNRDYYAVTRTFKKHGIMVCGAFVFGGDNDTFQSFEQAYSFAVKTKLCMSHFNPLFPTPGTPYYTKLEKENRLLYPSWWLAEDYRYGDLQFTPTHLSPAQVSEQCYRLRLRFNSWPVIFYRFLDFRANFKNPLSGGIYWLVNLLSRKEILKKQGLKLG